MPIIVHEIVIAAPVERVFDLVRSVDLHAESTRQTGERAVGGVTSGLLSLHDEVTWEATHFGVRQRLTSRIVGFSRPHHFRDSMVRGAFRRFDHDHHFASSGSGTVATDRFAFESPLGVLGRVANGLFLTRYMSAFLLQRLQIVKAVAESDEWQKYLEKL